MSTSLFRKAIAIPFRLVLYVLFAPILIIGYTVMGLITLLYSKKVWATPEEQRMTLPGDDLVRDPHGKKLLHVTQAADLNAPLEEVWKHIYQLDLGKAGAYSWSNCERIFGMNVDNAYTLQHMWQSPDALKPGDFSAWSYAGFGAEVADLVPNKYIVWFCNSANPSRTPGSSYMFSPGLEYINWNWTIALKPLDGGERCRIYSRYNIAYGPHNFLNFTLRYLMIVLGGAMMTRRMFENLEKSANWERRKSIPLRMLEAFLGRCRGDNPKLHKRVAYPLLSWSREFPRVASERAPFTDDPNWPPAPGKEYIPPIAENNAANGWTPETRAINDRKADIKEAELMTQLGIK